MATPYGMPPSFTRHRPAGMMGPMAGGPSPVGSPMANGPPQFSWNAGGPGFSAPGLGGGIMGGRSIPADVQAALDGMNPRDRGVANLFLTGQLPDAGGSQPLPTAPAPNTDIGGGGGSVPQAPGGGDDDGGGFPGMGLLSLLGGGQNMGLLNVLMNMRNGGGGGQQPQQAETMPTFLEQAQANGQPMPGPGSGDTMPTFIEQLQMSRRGMNPGGFPFGGFR